MTTLNNENLQIPSVHDGKFSTTSYETFGYRDGLVYHNALPTVGITTETNTETGETFFHKNRMYFNITMPKLLPNARIKKAEFIIRQFAANINSGAAPLVALYLKTDKVSSNETVTDYGKLIDIAKMKHQTDNVSYTFDISRALKDKIKSESEFSFYLAAYDENDTTENYITIFGAENGGESISLIPQLSIEYEYGFDVSQSYMSAYNDYGIYGKSYVDFLSGNLWYECPIITFPGLRSIPDVKYYYNSAFHGNQFTCNTEIGLNTADFSSMNFGNSGKLNIMQSMAPFSFIHNGIQQEGYIYIDETGKEMRFIQSDKLNDENYNLYKSIIDSNYLYDPIKKELILETEKFLFDDNYRLIKIIYENEDALTITYTDNKITSVTDSIGRVYTFQYDDNDIASITYPDGKMIEFSLTSKLNAIKIQNSDRINLNYSSISIYDTKPKQIYELDYTINDNNITFKSCNAGCESSITVDLYNNSATVRETEKQDTQGPTTRQFFYTYYVFNREGELITKYSKTPTNQIVEPVSDSDSLFSMVMDNNLKFKNLPENLIEDHCFNLPDYWSFPNSESSTVTAEICNNLSDTPFGSKALLLTSTDESNVAVGITRELNRYSNEITFSTYVKVNSDFSGGENSGVYLRLTDTNGNVISESEHFSVKTDDYIRIVDTAFMETSAVINAEILLNGSGSAYIQAPQLEKDLYASSYNFITSGTRLSNNNFWEYVGNVTKTSGLSGYGANIKGDIYSESNVNHKVYVKSNRDIKESFELSGWAKAFAIESTEREGIEQNQTYRLRAVIKYNDPEYEDYSTETYIADFNPNVEDWQTVNLEFSKSKYRIVDYIQIFCDYDYNIGTAKFDNISLIRTELETDLTAEDFPSYDEEPETEETNDTSLDIEEETPEFEEVKDAFGNELTETTYIKGELGTMYRSFEYDNQGNNLLSETDERGFSTRYIVNPLTSQNNEVIDRLGVKTAYEYDFNNCVTKTTCYDLEACEIANVSYSYDYLNRITEIVRGDGLKYVMNFNSFSRPESIGINGKAEKLVTYLYKNGNGRLKRITFANGDYNHFTYNDLGQIIAEKCYNVNEELTHHYKYNYSNEGNLVRTIDLTALKGYNYIYQGDNLSCSEEWDITTDESGIVTSKTVILSVRYSYNKDNELSQKLISYADGTERVINFETDEDEGTVLSQEIGNETLVSRSKTDGFGRKKYDELQTGKAPLSRRFSYLKGEITETHKENNLIKSSPTTNLVSLIEFSDNRRIEYCYDGEERITKVSDSLGGVTEYTYDSQGQLLTETLNGEVINSMTYDNYGNIKSKNGIQYSYGNAVWKDLLTKIGDKTITYDKQGNPLNYLGHTLTWEKGRQLKSFDGIQYTYNANGIRTSKTVDGVRHEFLLDGVKILREAWGNNTLETIFDNEDSVCGIIYNGVPYYFQKNLQSDVIAIQNVNGLTVARYTYDAWGKVTSIKGENILIGAINPYRYRGYYFDHETGLYYLQSRYYNPQIGRFINGDAAEFVTVAEKPIGHNLFTYCENDSVIKIDELGFTQYRVDLAVKSPNNLNSTVAFNMRSLSAGHTYIELFKDKKRVCSRGFWSETTRTMLVALSRLNFKGKIRNETSFKRTITASYKINKKKFNKIKEFLYQKNISNYNVVTHNCTTFAINALKYAGIKIKYKKHFWNMGNISKIAFLGLKFGNITFLTAQSPERLHVGASIMAISAFVLSFSLAYGYYPARLAYDIAHNVR